MRESDRLLALNCTVAVQPQESYGLLGILLARPALTCVFHTETNRYIVKTDESLSPSTPANLEKGDPTLIAVEPQGKTSAAVLNEHPNQN